MRIYENELRNCFREKEFSVKRRSKKKPNEETTIEISFSLLYRPDSEEDPDPQNSKGTVHLLLNVPTHGKKFKLLRELKLGGVNSFLSECCCHDFMNRNRAENYRDLLQANVSDFICKYENNNVNYFSLGSGNLLQDFLNIFGVITKLESNNLVKKEITINLCDKKYQPFTMSGVNANKKETIYNIHKNKKVETQFK